MTTVISRMGFSMSSFPTLPYPGFLSSAINKYLQEVSAQAGRHIVFVDLRAAKRPDSQAMIDVPPDLPAVAIFVDKAQINPAAYKAQLHDPLLAHEITHLQLNSEGWRKLTFDEDLDPITKQKLGAIENWLTDPVINLRIAGRGFSIGPNRDREIKESVKMLRKGNWSRNQQILGISDESTIQRFVSFCLEPEISKGVKASFREAFRADLRGLYDKGNDLLRTIEEADFDSPQKFEAAATVCMQKWGVDPQKVRFTAIRSFNTAEQEAWVVANPPEESWDKV